MTGARIFYRIHEFRLSGNCALEASCHSERSEESAFFNIGNYSTTKRRIESTTPRRRWR